jgi:hypothetical protein
VRPAGGPCADDQLVDAVGLRLEARGERGDPARQASVVSVEPTAPRMASPSAAPTRREALTSPEAMPDPAPRPRRGLLSWLWRTRAMIGRRIEQMATGPGLHAVVVSTVGSAKALVPDRRGACGRTAPRIGCRGLAGASASRSSSRSAT